MQQKFEVTLTLGGGGTAPTDVQLREIVLNIVDALIRQADNAGLTPENSDLVTEVIQVSCVGIKATCNLTEKAVPDGSPVKP